MNNEALCVRVLWGEQRVATHLIHPGHKLGLSSTGEAVTTEAPLKFEAGDRHFALAFQEGMVGEVLRNGETPLSLGDAIHNGLAVEDQKGWSFDIGRADVLRLGDGPVSFEAFRVRAPPKALGKLEDAVDFRFLNTLLICFGLFFAMAVNANLTEASELDDATSSQVTHMKNILVKAAEKPKVQQRVAEATSETTKQPKRKDNPNPSEGKPRPPNKTVADTGGRKMPTGADIAKSIFGGAGANNVLGPGGLGNEIKGALGHVVAVNGDGNGGWSIKGNGAGGENGDPERIGAIPTSKTASKGGIGELCRGPGPCKKGTTIIETDSTPPVVCDGTGCMDKELIRKVISGHRDQIRFCYELALQQSPSLAGKVSVQFAVGTQGLVSTARVANSSAPSEKLSECLVSRVRTWQFPVGRAGGVSSVTYPFVFKPSGS